MKSLSLHVIEKQFMWHRKYVLWELAITHEAIDRWQHYEYSNIHKTLLQWIEETSVKFNMNHMKYMSIYIYQPY